jgi:hypothetical protein
MKLFFKETVWREVKVSLSQEQEKVVAERVQRGEISNADDLYDYLYDEVGTQPYHNDFELETAEPMSREENDDQCTIEVYLTDGKKVEPDVTN